MRIFGKIQVFLKFYLLSWQIVMTMPFSLHENINLVSEEMPFEISPASAKNHLCQKPESFHLFNEKLTVPQLEDYLKRARLEEILQKSLLRFGAMLITGRTGTGKTALAADFARNYQHIAWFSVELTETDWEVFYQYFYESLRQMGVQPHLLRGNKPQGSENISSSLENLLANAASSIKKKPALIVIDGIHNVFDTEWFGEFFMTLLHSLSPQIHLLMLSRSAPPLPLWRLRSKQFLGVIDEKILAFTTQETEELLKKKGISSENVKFVHAETRGRISRLKNFINQRFNEQSGKNLTPEKNA